MPIGNRSSIVEHLFTWAGVKAILKIGVARRDRLPEQRAWLQEQESHRGSRSESIKGWSTKKALWTENREAWAEQSDLGAGPDGLDLASELESVIAASVGQVIR